MNRDKLKNAVVVITGATSGIGRATALAFARRGSLLVLAARDPEGLKSVASECTALGAETHTNVTDVTNPAAVSFLAEHAAGLGNGRIDVWINNAGVGAVGGFLDTPMDAHEQVIRTNLLGYLYGAHAVLPYFTERQEGVLINNISFGAWFPAPYAAAYSASKFGLEGFSQALRAEMSRWPKVRICDVYPSIVNTPGISEHGGNYLGRDLGKPSMAMEPEKVAEVMVSLARNPRDHTTVGLIGRAARIAHAVSPRASTNTAARFAELFLGTRPAQDITSGALYQPSNGHRAHGADSAPRQKMKVAATALTLGGAAYLLGRWAIPPKHPKHSAGFRFHR
ncbi:SDR family oxidoreductase [Marinimicrobium sp. ABcell2]|uniref:SDR family oxidoreductase n=1 Tax=Marinimicrobium sp. ABcell2 TaxID=3069751 RepID=UPI0027B44BC3|nr:SDR family oxidoreductase [Marinimicrobium sp. ABcell2]MDQ2078512.1 SDR family oxidoreductase [Marinimicrobium sp. ABcell2]